MTALPPCGFHTTLQFCPCQYSLSAKLTNHHSRIRSNQIYPYLVSSGGAVWFPCLYAQLCQHSTRCSCFFSASFTMQVNGEKSFWVRTSHDDVITGYGHYVKLASKPSTLPGNVYRHETSKLLLCKCALNHSEFVFIYIFVNVLLELTLKCYQYSLTISVVMSWSIYISRLVIYGVICVLSPSHLFSLSRKGKKEMNRILVGAWAQR